MTKRRTTSERIAELEKRESQICAQKKLLQKKGAEENRKARTKRLIMIGAEVEKTLDRPIEEHHLPKLRRFLENQEIRGCYFSKAMSAESAEGP